MESDKLKGILNQCLNEAFNGKNKIKGIPSSNKIAEFVNEWTQKNFNKKGGCYHEWEKLDGFREHCYKCHQIQSKYD